MGFQAIVTDLNGVVQGELTQATQRKLYKRYMGVPTLTGSVPLEHPLANTLLETDTLIKFYKTGVSGPIFVGPTVVATENSEPGKHSVEFVASGPYWRIAKRLIPGSLVKATGASYTGDLGQIARSVLTDVNSQSFTGIDLGTFGATVNGTAGPWFLKNAGEAISELSSALGSFEWRVRPTEPTAGAYIDGWPRIGLFDVAASFGTTKPDVVFEFGAGNASNVENYSRTVTRDSLLTRGYISLSGWPETPDHNGDLLVSQSSDIGTRGRFEDVVQDAGIVDDTLRQQLVDFHIDVRQRPKQTIVFKPVVNANPRALIDYDVGDTIRCRAVVNGIIRFDVLLRVWGMTIDVDDNGNESVELELMQS